MDFGGEMRFTFNSNPLILRAKFDSEPSSVEIDGGANQDNSTYRTLKPTGYVFEPTFQDNAPNVATSLDWEAILRGGPYNISLIEDSTGRLYTWTNAYFEGKPRVDHMTGEVSGIKGRAASFKKTTA